MAAALLVGCTSSGGGEPSRPAPSRPSTSGDGDPVLAVAPMAEGPGVVAVAARADGFVAVGSGAVWVSADGRSWDRVADTGMPAASLLSAAGTDDGGVVVAGAAGGTAFMARSDDGTAWQQVRVPGEAVVVDGVFATSPLVAVGRRADGEPTAWISGTGGRRWAEIGAVARSSAATTGIPVAVAGGDGALPLVAVLAAREDAPAPARRPLLARSDDGQRWTVVEPAGLAATDVVTSIVTAGGRFVAGGTDGLDARLWTSADGVSWEPVAPDEDEAGGDGPQLVTAMAAGGRRIVALGADGGVPVAWDVTCADSCALRRAAGRPATPVRAVAVDRRGRAVVVGGERSAAAFLVGERPATTPPAPGWQREVLGPGRASAVTASGPGWVAVGSRDDDAVAWVDVDGDGHWREVVLGSGPGVQQATGVASTAAGLIAVGADGGADSTDAAVWTSPDGLAWTRSVEPLLGGPGNQVATAVAADPAGTVVVVGSDDATGGGDGAAWRLVDGRWDRAAVDPLGLGGTGAQSVRGVSSGGDGSWVAVGVEAASGALDAVVWESADGVAWTRRTGDLAGPRGAGDQAFVAVAGGVAAGYSRTSGRDADAVVAELTAGSAVGSIGGRGHQAVNGLAQTAGGHVAGGVDGADAALWEATGDEGWRRVPHRESVFGGDGDQFVLAVAGAAAAVVAVGGDAGARGGPVALAWRRAG